MSGTPGDADGPGARGVPETPDAPGGSESPGIPAAGAARAREADAPDDAPAGADAPAGGETAEGGPEGGRGRIKKAPNAFRTISEVADELHIPQHVLRFWETKFPQVKPLKRGGGRRYYRPDDIALLRRISDLLYIQGYTIKGVQRLLREGGGRLSDDIPPAPAAERALLEADRAQHAGGGDSEPTPLEARDAPAASAPGDPARDDEVERLRRVLDDVLRQLEELRALLP